jgi:hypothetical protein
VTDVWWLDGIVVAAAIVAALSTIWLKAVRPFFHFTTLAAETLPILVEIAEEFRPNHGGSLRDVVDRIETQTNANGQHVAVVAVALADHVATDEASLAEIRRGVAGAADVAEALRLETARIAAEVAEALRIRASDVAAKLQARNDE